MGLLGEELRLGFKHGTGRRDQSQVYEEDSN